MTVPVHTAIINSRVIKRSEGVAPSKGHHSCQGLKSGQVVHAYHVNGPHGNAAGYLCRGGLHPHLLQGAVEGEGLSQFCCPGGVTHRVGESIHWGCVGGDLVGVIHAKSPTHGGGAQAAVGSSGGVDLIRVVSEVEGHFTRFMGVSSSVSASSGRTG